MTAPRTDRLTMAGLAVVAAAAAGTSFTALSGLARSAGWSPDVCPALPVVVDVLAAVSTRAWLSGSAPVEAKRFAKRSALLSVVVSMAGNIGFHLLQAGYLRASVVLVILVAMIPPIGLAAAAHLVAVLRSAEPTEEVSVPAVAPVVMSVPMAAPVTAEASAEPVTVTDTRADTKQTAPRTPRRTDTATAVARLKTKHPDMTAADIAAKVGVTDRTVRRHLTALTAA